VDLKSGGYLIIDQTEALTTVDVTPGGYVGRALRRTIFKDHLGSHPGDCRNCGLRNLGGIIIRLHRHGARGTPGCGAGQLRKQLARDRTRSRVSGFTQLAWWKMTRKRTRDRCHMLCEPCPICEGKGSETPRSVCLRHPARNLREARQFNPKSFVSSRRRRWWRSARRRKPALAGLSDFIGKPISLHRRAGSPEQYDIVLK